MHTYVTGMGFSDYTQKGYCSTTLKACTNAHITRTPAHITRTLNHTLHFRFAYCFTPVPFDSLVVLLYRSWLQHCIALNFSITHKARGALFEIGDRYIPAMYTHKINWGETNRAPHLSYWCAKSSLYSGASHNGPSHQRTAPI